MIAEKPTHLFVYGTLMRGAGHPMHRVLAQNARYVCDAWFTGRLYQVHHYPGVVISKNPDDKVFGELYALHATETALAALDDYEGCGAGMAEPTEFVRSLQTVHRCDGSPVQAWVYLYNRPLGAAPCIRSGRYISA